MSNVLSVPRVVLYSKNYEIALQVASGLAIVLREKKIGLSCCVEDRNLNAAVTLKRLTKRNVGILDSGTLNTEGLLATLQLSSRGADIVLIIGKPELAHTINAPLIVIKDNNDMEFSGKCSAVILFGENSSSIEAERIIGAIKESDITFGAASAELCEASPAGMQDMQKLINLAKVISGQLNIDKFISIAKQAGNISIGSGFFDVFPRTVRMAVSDDSCFNLAYQTNFEMLNYFGADLIPFSPVVDEKLPERIGAVYLTGASIQSYAEDLANNATMLNSIRKFADNGGVIYAEGSAAAYMAKSYHTDSKVYPGLEIFPAEVRFKPESINYFSMTLTEDAIIGSSGFRINGMGLNNLELFNMEMGNVYPSSRMTYNGSVEKFDGFAPLPQVFLTTAYINFMTNPEAALALIQSANVVSRSERG